MMKLNLIIAVMTCGIILTGQNLLNNSSFELKTAEWGVIRFIKGQPIYLNPEFDSTEKVHGQFCLKIVNPEANGIRILSHEVQLKTDQQYTLSFYAKSTQPIKIKFGVLGGCKGKHNPQRNQKELTNTWRRYHLSFKPPKGFNYYSVDIQWGNVNKIKNNATVWIDAVQLNSGTLKEYVPKKTMEASFILSKRVQVKDEPPITAELYIANYGSKPQVWQGDLKLYDTYNKKVIKKWQEKVTVAPGNITQKKLDVGTEKIGCYCIQGQGVLNKNFVTVAKTPIQKIDLRKTFVGGVDEPFGYIFSESRFTTTQITPYMSFGLNLEEYMQFLQNSGVNLLRAGNTGCAFNWRYLEPQKGKFDWHNIDRLVNITASHNMKIMPVLGNMPYLRRYSGGIVSSRLPAWLIAKSKIIKINKHWDMVEFPIEDWKSFIRSFVSRYKGRITCWEIFNEPNLLMPAKVYRKYLKAAYETIKGIDPDAIVVGFCSTGDLGGRMLKFMKEAGQEGALKYCDAVSFHPYSTRSDISIPSAKYGIDGMRRTICKYRKNLPLWNTELYFLIPQGDSTNNRAFHLIRRILVDLGEGVKQSICLCNTSLLQFELCPHWSGVPVAYLGYGNLVPSEMYVAQNTVGRLFSGATPIRPLELAQSIRGYLFRNRNGELIAACWSTIGSIDYSLKLSSKIKAFDIFGNPLTGEKVKLGRDPIYFQGIDLDKWISKQKPVSDFKYIVSKGAFVFKNKQFGIAVKINNIADKDANLQVTLKNISNLKALRTKENVKLKANSSSQAFFPVEPTYAHRCNAETADIQINDRVFSIPLARRSIIKPGFKVTLKNLGNVKIGSKLWKGPEDCSFSVKTKVDAKFFRLEITVKDDKRNVSQPTAWDNDGIELYIDSHPAHDLENIGYTPYTYSLFLNPAANGKPAIIGSSKNLKLKGIVWNVIDTQNGYKLNIAIPWKSIGLDGPASIAFDVMIDDNDGGHRKSQMLLGGTVNNYKQRNNFVLLRL